MVMVLLVVLILGIVTIAATIVIRLGGLGGGAAGISADRLVLPAGEVVTIGQGEGTALIVLRGEDGAERLLVYDAGSGALLSTTDLARE